MANYRQIFKYTGLLGSVQSLYIIIAVLRNKIAAMFIGPTGMGMAELYLRSLDLVGNATNFGLGFSAIRKLSASYQQATEQGQTITNAIKAEIRIIRTWVLITALLGMLVCIILSPLISMLSTNNWDHTRDFILLSPIVLFSTLMGGEMAVLKATRQLKRLALASTLGALATLIISTIIYVKWGRLGIMPVLFLTSAAIFGFNFYEATRRYPYRIAPFKKRHLRKGLPLLRLGTAYLIAGVMTTGSEMLIRSAIIRSYNGLAYIGYYAAGFTLCVSYARMVFVAMDADFFPRLSATIENRREMNLNINRQINMLVVLMAPLLIVLGMGLPVIIRILYTEDFLKVIPMVLCAAPLMFFKAIYTPIAYIPLARGDSFRYMTMELIYNIVFCILVIIGYQYYGLIGAGIGLALSNLFDLLAISIYYHHCYGYRMNTHTFWRCISLLIILLTGLFAASIPNRIPRYTGCMLCLLIIIPIIWPILKKIRRKM